MVTILLTEFEKETETKSCGEDCFDVFPGQECFFLGDDTNESVLFERPEKVMKSHLRPLHIKADIAGKMVNRVLVDGEAASNLLPKSMLTKFGKTVDQLVKANVVVTDFTGKTSISKGIVMFKVRVGSVDRITPVVVIASKAGYNALLGREWIHEAGVVPSTLHQKLIIWNGEGNVEMVQADDSLCYFQQAHVDFKVYNLKVKPLVVDASTFDPELIERCYFGRDGSYFTPKAEAGSAQQET